MNERFPIGWLLALAVFLALLIPTASSLRTFQVAANRAMAVTEMISFLAAMTNYANTYGTLPKGNAATVFASLSGENPNKIVFLAVGAKQINSAGQFVDSWGTPFQILMTNQNVVVISSAGQNRAFGDADDITFAQPWQSTNLLSAQPVSPK
ncbi:MAG: hypothetical protein HY298_17120 [Verrucomicrobia bacterium]|nr:hypothetical protein [Verrucomicrobiota bacterium]